MVVKSVFRLQSSSWFSRLNNSSLWQMWYKMEWQLSWIFFLIHQLECRFIIVKVLMVFEVSPSFEGQNGGVIISSESFKTNWREGILKRPSPRQKPSSSACQSIILPTRARLLIFWETVILRSPVDFKLMTFCFLYFQNRRSANLSFPGQCFLDSIPLRIQSELFSPQFLFINSANSKTWTYNI